MPRLLVFTPLHGFFDITQEAIERIDKYVPAPFDALIIDDFSPPEHAAAIQDTAGPIMQNGEQIGQRIVHHSSTFGGVASPNVGLNFKHCFEFAREGGYDEILVVIYKALIHPGIVEAFREADRVHGPRTGEVAGIITRHDGDTVYSVGGPREDYGIGGQTPIPGVHIEQKLGEWRGDWPGGTPRLGTLPWAHYTTILLPKRTFTHPQIVPDVSFPMYYVDLDLSRQIQRAGFDVIVTDRALSECGGRGLTTDLAWGAREEQPAGPHSGPKHQAQVDGRNHFERKWG